MSKKATKKAKRAIVEGGGKDRATFALLQYQHFLQKGGKRPNIHDATGRIIAPICPQLVSVLVDVANRGMEERIEFNDFLAVGPKRQRLRAWRRGQHEFRRQANLASARHERESGIKATPDVVKPIHHDGTPPPSEVVAEAQSIYAKTEALYKGGSNRLTVVAFFNGRDNGAGWDKARRRTVFYVEKDGTVTEGKARAGGAKSMSIDKLLASGWKWGRLEDDEKFAPILGYLTAGKKQVAA